MPDFTYVPVLSSPDQKMIGKAKQALFHRTLKII